MSGDVKNVREYFGMTGGMKGDERGCQVMSCGVRGCQGMSGDIRRRQGM